LCWFVFVVRERPDFGVPGFFAKRCPCLPWLPSALERILAAGHSWKILSLDQSFLSFYWVQDFFIHLISPRNLSWIYDRSRICPLVQRSLNTWIRCGFSYLAEAKTIGTEWFQKRFLQMSHWPLVPCDIILGLLSTGNATELTQGENGEIQSTTTPRETELVSTFWYSSG